MEFHSLSLPVWKTKDYVFEISDLIGMYYIYMNRSGLFYAKNPQGIKFKFGAKNEEEFEFYKNAQRYQKPISLGLMSIMKESE